MLTKGNFTKFGVVEESSYGVTPASALQLLNLETIDFKRSPSASRPAVLTGDRRRYPKRQLSLQGALQLAGPLQYENLLLLEEGLQMSSRGSAVSIAATTLACVSTNEITDSANGLGNIAVGDLVYVSGFTTAANNGWKGPILTAAAGSITFPSGQVSAESAGDSVTIKTRRLVDGSTAKSYSAEYQLPQLTNQFKAGVGYRVGEMSWGWAQGEWAKQSVTLMGKTPAMASATIGTGAATAAKTTGFQNSVHDFGALRVLVDSTTLLTLTATKIDLKVMNALTAAFGLGTLGPSQIVIGSQDIEASIDFYFDDDARDLTDAVEGQDTLCIWWDDVDAQGNRCAYCLAAVKPDDGDIAALSADNIVNVPVTFSGHDPAKDSSSIATSIPYQFAKFYVPAA